MASTSPLLTVLTALFMRLSRSDENLLSLGSIFADSSCSSYKNDKVIVGNCLLLHLGQFNLVIFK